MYRLLLIVFLAFSLSTNAQNALNFVGTATSGTLVNTNQPAITGNAARTVEAWVNIRSTVGTAQMVIVDMGNTATGGRFTLNVINGQHLRIEIGGSGFDATNVDISDDNWHHVAATYNPSNGAGQKGKLYIDGVFQVQSDFTIGMNTAATNNIRIGGRTDNVNYFTGNIDDVRVWNVERTGTQIAADYMHELCTIPTGLIAYYKFNEGIAGGTNTSISSVANAANSTYTGSLLSFSKTGATSNFVTGAPIAGGSTSTISPVECTSYTVPSNSRTLTVSGTYYDTLPNSVNCDSIITINLTVLGGTPFTNLAASNITDISALITWDSILNAAGYEYVLDQSSTPPATTASGTTITDTFYNATGLTLSTTYYFHIRPACGTPNTSQWTTISFRTNDACYALTGLDVSNITETSATFSWDAATDALWYEYAVSYDANPPGGSGSGTTKTSYTAGYLLSNETYFFHVRKKCMNYLWSPWESTTFTTLPPTTTDVADLKEDQFTISPNPTTGKVFIKTPFASGKEKQIIVTDVFGKTLKSTSNYQNEFEFDLSELPSGIYYLRCSVGNETHVKQIAIHH